MPMHRACWSCRPMRRSASRWRDYLGLPDASIELKLTPNRPDCLSVHGLARDVGALFGSDVPSRPRSKRSRSRSTRSARSASTPAPIARAISAASSKASIPTAKTPLWLAERLRRSGLRPISAVVDVTNYVMLELGQPLHAFDNAKLSGTVVVRRARNGEKLKLLDGSEHALTERFLVIADDERARSRSAASWAASIRASPTRRATCSSKPRTSHRRRSWAASRELALHSDAAHRFERGVDPELPRKRDRARDRTARCDRRRQGGSGHRSRARRRSCRARAGLAAPRAPRARARHRGRRRRSRAHPHRARHERRAHCRRLARDAAELALRYRDRGRPDRGSRPRARLRPRADARAARRASRAAAAGSAARRRPFPRAARRARLSSKRSASRFLDAATLKHVEARRRRGPAGQSAVGRARRHAHVAAAGPRRGAASNRRRQQERVRLFELGNVFQPRQRRPTKRRASPASPCGSVAAEQWGETPRRTGRLLRRQGRCRVDARRSATAAGDAFRWEPADAPWLHPGQSAPSSAASARRLRRRAASGPRQGARRSAPTSMCSSSTSTRSRRARVPSAQPRLPFPVAAPRSRVRAAGRRALRTGRSG